MDTIFCMLSKNQSRKTYHFFMGSTFYINTINLKADMIERKRFAMCKLAKEINMKYETNVSAEQANVY